MRMPALFVSHGAPDILLHRGKTLALWDELGQTLPTPAAILVVSAHWTTPNPLVSSAAHPRTIHDFGGFPRELYQIHYPAPGSLALAQRVEALLADASIPIQRDPAYGLDHGAWVPLTHLYPDANIPVAQLSVQPGRGPEWHFKLGQALAPLREENILLLASGAVTHNFAWLSALSQGIYPPAGQFTEWVAEKIALKDWAAMLNYRLVSQYGAEAHPTDEHFLPLFVALGSMLPDEVATRFTPEFTYGALAMDAYQFG
ncbi:MAG TPA: class III extradiol ring-cleavage dioxygenase [Pseudomonadales bacterium]|nr:class III extradiol ring-cleavage dioxygenase [Pseudomonadales bacterium]